jgi:hypothetical protein
MTVRIKNRVCAKNNERTKVSAAPFVFFSPPSSKLIDHQNRLYREINESNALLATFEGHLHLVFAHSALQSQDNLLRCLCLFMKAKLNPFL